MCGPDDRFFSGAHRWHCNPSDLSQARGVSSALVKRLLRCMCSVSGGAVYTRVDFLEFFPGNRNHHHFSDDVGRHELRLVCHCEVGHCEVEDEDEDAASGFLSLQYRHPVLQST